MCTGLFEAQTRTVPCRKHRQFNYRRRYRYRHSFLCNFPLPSWGTDTDSTHEIDYKHPCGCVHMSVRPLLSIALRSSPTGVLLSYCTGVLPTIQAVYNVDRNSIAHSYSVAHSSCRHLSIFNMGPPSYLVYISGFIAKLPVMPRNAETGM